MATVRKTITLTDAQDDSIKAQVASGDYTNDSEYLRDRILIVRVLHYRLNVTRHM